MSQRLKNEIIRLLKEDEEFRYTVIGLIGLEEVLKRLDRHEEQLVKLREDMVKGFELVERHISAIGARWGIMSEEAFRAGIKGLLEKEFKVKVERWEALDEGGIVYGYPCIIEVDLIISDDRLMLIEITSHARASDVRTLKMKSALYEKKAGRKPDRLLIITPYADESAVIASKGLGVELYTKV